MHLVNKEARTSACDVVRLSYIASNSPDWESGEKFYIGPRPREGPLVSFPIFSLTCLTKWQCWTTHIYYMWAFCLVRINLLYRNHTLLNPYLLSWALAKVLILFKEFSHAPLIWHPQSWFHPLGLGVCMPSLKLWQLEDAEEKGIRSQRQTKVRLKKVIYLQANTKLISVNWSRNIFQVNEAVPFTSRHFKTFQNYAILY